MPYDSRGRWYDDGPRGVEHHYHGSRDGGYAESAREALSAMRETVRDIDRRLDRFEHRLEENRRYMVQATVGAAAVMFVLFVVLIVTYWN